MRQPTLEDWQVLFDTAKLIKLGFVYTGIPNVVIGFNDQMTIMRIAQLPTDAVFPEMLFETKDIKNIIPAMTFGPKDVSIESDKLSFIVDPPMEWYTNDEGELVIIHPSIPLVNNLYVITNVKNMVNRVLFEDSQGQGIHMSPEKLEEVVNISNTMKAKDNKVYISNGRYSFFLFYGLINTNKGDGVDISFKDINDTIFSMKISVYRKKVKTYIHTFVNLFVI